MNIVISSLTYLYSRLLRLYPGGFRNEFSEEMLVVFRDSVNEAVKEGALSVTFIWLRELVALPFNILREVWHEFGRKGTHMVTSESIGSKLPISVGQHNRVAILAALPFALFGFTSMLAKIELPFQGLYLFLSFYALVLVGLFWGLISGVPRWTYSYLGWAGFFAWWWTSMGVFGVKIFGYTMVTKTWGLTIWYPLFLVIGLALLWKRSLRPLGELLRGIWQDWTLLSLALYAFAGLALLVYDENHSPYLFVFMVASTLAITLTVWQFMRSTTALHRFLVLLSGFAGGLVIGWICELTWDFAEYYGLPQEPAMAWYDHLLRMVIITGFWALILFWPAIIGLLHVIANNRPKPGMPA